MHRNFYSPLPHHEDAVVIHISLNLSSKLLPLTTGRRCLRGGAGLHLLLQAPPILSYPLQHQLTLLADQHTQDKMFCSEITKSVTWLCNNKLPVWPSWHRLAPEVCLFNTADLFLLSSLCSGLLSNTLSLLLFKVTLVLLDAGLNG